MRSFYRTKPKRLLIIVLVISFLFLIYQVYHLTNLSSLLSPAASTATFDLDVPVKTNIDKSRNEHFAKKHETQHSKSRKYSN